LTANGKTREIRSKLHIEKKKTQANLKQIQKALEIFQYMIVKVIGQIWDQIGYL
jgi:hypothetical protein